MASGDNGGKDCHARFANGTDYPIVASSSAWDPDSWASDPNGDVLFPKQGNASITTWESDGDWLEGCSNTVTWSTIDDTDPPSPPLTVSVTTYEKWDGSDWSNTCDVTAGGAGFICRKDTPPDDGAGNSRFIIMHR